MSTKVTVTAAIGYYLVCSTNHGTVKTNQVSKEKRCTCGGTSDQPCPHIQAVAQYLHQGGRQAQRPPDGRPLLCPVCETPVEHRGPAFWRCPRDSSHYWQWSGERNEGAVRKFLTQPHPNKQGPFYEQTIEERQAFLAEARQRMRAGGYTPHL